MTARFGLACLCAMAIFLTVAESYDQCGNNEVLGCGDCDDTCKNFDEDCLYQISNGAPCKKQACTCKQGFLRNKAGQCVTEDNCECYDSQGNEVAKDFVEKGLQNLRM